MKKTTVNQESLHLLVSVYNQSIQTYYHFPEVILCGRQRMDYESFALLQHNGWVVPRQADSFGQNFYLSKKGEKALLAGSCRRRTKRGKPAAAHQLSVFSYYG